MEDIDGTINKALLAFAFQKRVGGKLPRKRIRGDEVRQE